MDVLHVKATHFQTTQINLRFFTSLKQPDNTVFKLMLAMMNQKNQMYPSRKAWKSRLKSIYNMRIGASSSRLKDLLISDFKMTLIDPSLVSEPHAYFYEAMDQLLNHPLFDEESLTFEKGALHDEFLTKKSSKSYRAAKILTDSLFKDHPYLIRTAGDEDVIDSVTLELIKKAYQRLKEAPVVMSVVGPLDEKEIKALIDHLKLSPKETFKKPGLIKQDIPLLKLAPVKNDMKQLLMYEVYQTHIYPDEALHLAYDIFSYMLGGDSESILFKTIRETHSMAYSVGATSLDDFGVLLIQGAIDPQKKEVYKEELKAIMNRLKNGDFDESLLNQAKLSRIEEIKRNTDNKSALASRAMHQFLEGWPFDLEDLIEPFYHITKEDIIKVALKIEDKGSFEFGAVHE